MGWLKNLFSGKEVISISIHELQIGDILWNGKEVLEIVDYPQQQERTYRCFAQYPQRVPYDCKVRVQR